MLIPIPNLPDNALGFEAVGEVEDDDYDKVLVPAMEEKLKSYDKIRLLYYFGPQYEEFDADAMWDDTKVGLKHLTDFEKIAVVADEKWIRRSIKAFGWLIPGEVKLFDNAGLEDAKTWIAI